MKINRLIQITQKRHATLSRVITEIHRGRWGFSGQPVTTRTECNQSGLIRFCRAIRARHDAGWGLITAVERRLDGRAVQVLPLP